MLTKRINNKFLRELAELCIAVVIATAVFLLTYNFIARTGLVEGSSMQPTLDHGDLVIINKAAYWFAEPVMGDIIAFPDPESVGRYLIKRVIGVSGDEINIQNGDILLNNEPLPPEFRIPGGGSHNIPLPMTVPAGTVFVVGDNRRVSLDSRSAQIGNVPVDDIIGKVSLRLFPFRSFGILR